jgi:hypothetical protein
MQQWGKNLASYYTGMGWNGCPHLFVGYDKILVLNKLISNQSLSAPTSVSTININKTADGTGKISRATYTVDQDLFESTSNFIHLTMSRTTSVNPTYFYGMKINYKSNLRIT